MFIDPAQLSAWCLNIDLNITCSNITDGWTVTDQPVYTSVSAVNDECHNILFCIQTAGYVSGLLFPS